jgi:hypothetical protein
MKWIGDSWKHPTRFGEFSQRYTLLLSREAKHSGFETHGSISHPGAAILPSTCNPFCLSTATPQLKKQRHLGVFISRVSAVGERKARVGIGAGFSGSPCRPDTLAVRQYSGSDQRE